MIRVIKASRSVSYRVYEIDEDGDEIDCLKVFRDKDKAIDFADKYDELTHVVMFDPADEYTEVIWSKE